MNICPRCKIEHNSKFKCCDDCREYIRNWRSKHPRVLTDKQKERQKEISHKHFENNKEYYHQRTHARRRVIRQFMLDIKSKLGCSRCPERDPVCLNFHHKDPKTKSGQLADAINEGWSKKKILDEIAKCEVLCANCHLKEHEKQRQATFNDIAPIIYRQGQRMKNWVVE